MSDRDRCFTHIYCCSTSETRQGHIIVIRLRCSFPGKTSLVLAMGNLRRDLALAKTLLLTKTDLLSSNCILSNAFQEQEGRGSSTMSNSFPLTPKAILHHDLNGLV